MDIINPAMDAIDPVTSKIVIAILRKCRVSSEIKLFGFFILISPFIFLLY